MSSIFKEIKFNIQIVFKFDLDKIWIKSRQNKNEQKYLDRLKKSDTGQKDREKKSQNSNVKTKWKIVSNFSGGPIRRIYKL